MKNNDKTRLIHFEGTEKCLMKGCILCLVVIIILLILLVFVEMNRPIDLYIEPIQLKSLLEK